MGQDEQGGALGALGALGEVLANARVLTLEQACASLRWLLAIPPDDLTHIRPQTHWVGYVHHAGEKEPRAVVMPIEAYRALIQAIPQRTQRTAGRPRRPSQAG